MTEQEIGQRIAKEVERRLQEERLRVANTLKRLLCGVPTLDIEILPPANLLLIRLHEIKDYAESL
jgi:hypothetical protein